MKTAYLLSLSLFIIIGLVSCDNEETPATVDNSTTTAIPNTRSISSFTSSPKPVQNTTPVSSNTSTATVLNPAHGQPNHRCDIAVGAPLNSAPTQTSGPQTQSPVSISPVQGTAPVQVSAPVISNPINTTNTKANTATTAAGMNPPHGQPNHRCDIAVGAPLNSAPIKSVATQTAANTNKPIAPIAPVAPVAAGMNPPHGQPNHRCDIAVGAPLNSAPTNKVAPVATTGPIQVASPTTTKQNK